jgi:hypothetical protein
MRRLAIVCSSPLLLAACSGSSGYAATGTPVSPSSSDADSNDAGRRSDDASIPVVDPGQDGASPPPNEDSGTYDPSGDDAGSASALDASLGPPARDSTCTPLSQQTGTAVNTTHGRLDGTLVYVLPIDGSNSCNGDSAHVHLQVEVSGSVYDVAVDIGKSGDEVGWYEKTMAVPGGTWAEGWHGSDELGYESLGLTSSAFTTLAPTDMGNEVESLLANTSQISIFCTGYTPGDNGCHDVHYEDGTSQDGALVLDPTSATSPVVFFNFTGQSF